LGVDTDISEDDIASIFRIHVCRFRNRLGYIEVTRRGGGHEIQGEVVKKETQS
jgi:hypothetical protein